MTTTFSPVKDLTRKQQTIIIDHAVKYANSHCENIAETVTKAMNSMLCELDDMLPEYMQYSTAADYFKVILDYCTIEEVVDIWNAYCEDVDHPSEYIHEMSKDFNECLSDEDPADIVCWTKHPEFCVKDKYFTIKQDERMNIEIIYSYSDIGVMSVVDYETLTEWMAENPEMAADHVSFSHAVAVWFDL